MSTFLSILLDAIDREAKRIGVTRQAFIKLRIADTLDRAEEVGARAIAPLRRAGLSYDSLDILTELA